MHQHMPKYRNARKNGKSNFSNFCCCYNVIPKCVTQYDNMYENFDLIFSKTIRPILNRFQNNQSNKIRHVCVNVWALPTNNTF